LIVAYTTGQPGRPVAQGIAPLPENVYLMSWFVRTGSPATGHTEYVLRLQNVAEHSADVEVDLSTLFLGVAVELIEETTLALDNVGPRRTWGSVASVPLVEGKSTSSPSVVLLSSLDIRTFFVVLRSA